MEIFNGQQLTPVYNFYTIIITKTTKDINSDKFCDELLALTKKIKSTRKGIWLKIDEPVYKKLDIKLLQLLQKEYTFYYNDNNEHSLIFVASKLKTYPPAPNTNIGTHLMIMTPDNQILTTIEDNEITLDELTNIITMLNKYYHFLEVKWLNYFKSSWIFSPIPSFLNSLAFLPYTHKV